MKATTTGKAVVLLWLWLSHGAFFSLIEANPHSRPYIPFRTSSVDHPFVKHTVSWNDDRSNSRRSRVKEYMALKDENYQRICPLSFTLGVSRRAHHRAQNSEAFSIVKPPIIHPTFPARGPGRQLVHTTLYEHLDLLSPETAAKEIHSASGGDSDLIKEGLIQHQEFPLLFESSSFAYSSPIIHDVNGDGIPDAIVSDYDGGIYVVGLHQGREGKRWFHKAQVPRLFVRRGWVENRINEILEELHPAEVPVEGVVTDESGGSRDPYHSYFEYSAAPNFGQKDVLQGVTANVLGQKRNDLDALQNRRSKRHESNHNYNEENDHYSDEGEDEQAVEHRRLQEVSTVKQENNITLFWHGSLDVKNSTLETIIARRRLQEFYDEERKDQKQGGSEGVVPGRYSEEQRERLGAEENDQSATGEREMEEVQESNPQAAQDIERKSGEETETSPVLDHEKREQEDKDRQTGERVAAEQEPKHDEQLPGQQQSYKHVDTELEEIQRQELEEVQAQDSVHNVESESDGGGKRSENDETENEVEKSNSGSDGGDAGGTAADDDADDDAYAHHAYVDDVYPEYHSHEDDMYGGPAGSYDDYYGRYRSYRDRYYDERNYVRVNPHILTTPTLAEISKMYGNEDEVEDMLFVPVSYYLDEDEYEGHLHYRRFENTDPGDETEVQRGLYVASAIMILQLSGEPRWGRQEHLDLSSDHSAPQNVTLLGKIPVREDNTKMGAFALSKPAVADIDGDGKLEVLIATSMGIVYAFDATHMTMKQNWPIQMQHAVESPIVVEDLAANTKLETLIADIGGNVACFDEDANKVWHRDLRAAVSDGPSTVRASSPMTIGDVDGDGFLDVVVALQMMHEETQREVTYVFALSGGNGDDIPTFPLSFNTPPVQRSNFNEDWIHQQLPGLLLVDLHQDQSHIRDYIRRNGTKWEKRKRSSRLPGGGTAAGLHIVLPVGETLHIVEAGSGCITSFGVGEEMVAMVQVDDVHGTNNLDLVLSTVAGNIITMESSSPYHPLNVWNNGEIRGRMNNYAHGYTASQGIFVHSVSREYRDIFGVFIPVTFEIFDNRPNIQFEPDKMVYKVEIRDGTSTKRAIWRNVYNETGVFTERLYIPHGAGYYALTVQLRASNGIVYEDMFHIGYNVNYMDGFGVMLLLPLWLAAITVFLGSSRKIRWDEDDYQNRDRTGGGLGILG